MARTASETFRIGVLTSGQGRGSNLRAMHDWFRDQALPVEIALVVATHAESPVRGLCAERGLPCELISARDMTRFEDHLKRRTAYLNLDLIALAGFMRLLSSEFIDGIGIPILNIHPALLPLYGGKGMYGMNVHNAVFASGDTISGATIHRVDPQYDHGRIIAQERVDISVCRSAEEIAATVLKVEHRLYAPAIYSYLTAGKA